MPKRRRAHGSTLGRTTKQRKALYKGLLRDLIIHESITTTTAKAKAIRPLVDKLVTKAKKGTLHARRQVHAKLNHKQATNKLVDDIAKRSDRTSGHTTIQKLGLRPGDNASVAKISWVDKPKEEKKKSKKKEK